MMKSEPTVEAPKGTTTNNKGKSTFFDLIGSYSESVKTTMNRLFRPVVSKATVFSQNSDQLIEAALSKKQIVQRLFLNYLV